MPLLDCVCPFCEGKVEYEKHDWILVPNGIDERDAIHKDCYFDKPREHAPDTSDDGDGFSWENFWGEQEDRADARDKR